MQQPLDLKFNPFNPYCLLLKIAPDYWVRKSSYILETKGFDLAVHRVCTGAKIVDMGP